MDTVYMNSENSRTPDLKIRSKERSKKCCFIKS